MHKIKYIALAVALSLILLPTPAQAETYGLETLDLQHVEQGWGEPHANQSVDGHALTLGGKQLRAWPRHARQQRLPHCAGRQSRAVHRHASAWMTKSARRAASCSKSSAMARPSGRAVCCAGATRPRTFPLTLNGVKMLVLTVGDAGDGINYDHADWADAKIVMSGRQARSCRTGARAGRGVDAESVRPNLALTAPGWLASGPAHLSSSLSRPPASGR